MLAIPIVTATLPVPAAINFAELPAEVIDLFADPAAAGGGTLGAWVVERCRTVDPAPHLLPPLPDAEDRMVAREWLWGAMVACRELPPALAGEVVWLAGLLLAHVQAEAEDAKQGNTFGAALN
jgi:hypothetical protein